MATATAPAAGTIADSLYSRNGYGTGQATVLNFYQKYISPLKGGNTCPMHPSCSQYAKVACENDHPFIGFTATCDRLIRCGRDQGNYPLVIADSMLRAYDPVSGSDLTSEGSEPVPLHVVATENDTCSAFANQLFKVGQYVPSVVEYERILYSEKSCTCKMSAAFGLLQVSSVIETPERFTTAFYRLVDSVRADPVLYAKSGLLLARVHYNNRRYSEALSALGFYVKCDDPAIMDKRYFLASLCRLSAGSVTAAVNVADSLAATEYLQYTTALSTIDAASFGRASSPALAGIFSALVPGSGYIYAHRPQTAFASLFINSLFFCAAYECFSRKLYATGSAAAVLGMGFYVGNIRGSAKAASMWNRQERERKIAELIRLAPAGN